VPINTTKVDAFFAVGSNVDQTNWLAWAHKLDTSAFTTQLTAQSRTTTVPPGVPTLGLRWLVPSIGATGAWAGHGGKIAIWVYTTGFVATWEYLIPDEGWHCWVADEDAMVRYTGTAWVAASSIDLSPYVALDGSRPMTGALNMSGKKIINLLEPTALQDAATKYYVDTKVASTASAGGVSVSPSGNILATNVQNALVGLDTGKIQKTGDTGIGSLTFASASRLRLTNVNETSSIDGTIGLSTVGDGLNIVGAQTVASAGRKIRLIGTVLDQTGNVLRFITFTGDAGSGGTTGYVPAPASGDTALNKFLSASGSWARPTVSTSGDVQITAIANNHTLIWNVATSKWINAALSNYTKVSELLDVNGVAVPTNSQVLAWNTSINKWTPTTFPGGVTVLSALSDVNFTSLANGSVLTYNSTTLRWVDAPPPAAAAVSSLSDAAIASPINGQGLIYNSSTGKWANATLPTGVTTLALMTDVALSSLSNKHALMYDAAALKWTNRIVTTTDLGNWSAAAPTAGQVPAWSVALGLYVPTTIATALSGLSDVVITTPTTGQRLEYNAVGGTWTNKPNTFVSLTDVAIASVANGHSVIYNSGTATWTNRLLTHNDISTFNAPTPSVGHSLVWNIATSKFDAAYISSQYVAFTPTGSIGSGTVAGAIAELGLEKLALAGGTMNGQIDMGADKIIGLAYGTANTDAAAFGQLPVAATVAPVINGAAAVVGISTKYAREDHVHPSAVGTSLPIMNGTAAVGVLVLASRQDHVHPSDTTRLALAGGTMTGPIAMTADKITGLANGTAATDAAAFGQIPLAATAAPLQVNTVAAVGTSTKFAREDHVHESPIKSWGIFTAALSVGSGAFNITSVTNASTGNYQVNCPGLLANQYTCLATLGAITAGITHIINVAAYNAAGPLLRVRDGSGALAALTGGVNLIVLSS
jgi:Protein of unknown function (DUF2793)